MRTKLRHSALPKARKRIHFRVYSLYLAYGQGIGYLGAEVQIGTKFSIAIHILLSVEVFKDKHKITSDFLAASANTNPVMIRKIMGLVREAGLIEVAKGTGGITLLKTPKEITLKDIYLAVNPIEDWKLFNIHKNSAAGCPVGGNILNLLDPYFTKAQNAMENNLSNSTLQNLLNDLKNR